MQRRLLKETRAKRRDSLHWNCAHTIANQLNCSTRPKYQHESIINTEVGKTAVVLLHPYFFFLFMNLFYLFLLKQTKKQNLSNDWYWLIHHGQLFMKHRKKHYEIWHFVSVHKHTHTIVYPTIETQRNQPEFHGFRLFNFDTNKKKIENWVAHNTPWHTNCKMFNERMQGSQKQTHKKQNQTNTTRRLWYESVVSMLFYNMCTSMLFISNFNVYPILISGEKSTNRRATRGEISCNLFLNQMCTISYKMMKKWLRLRIAISQCSWRIIRMAHISFLILW